LIYGVVVKPGQNPGLHPYYIKLPWMQWRQCRKWHSGTEQPGRRGQDSSGSLRDKGGGHSLICLGSPARGYCRSSRSDAAGLPSWVVDHFT